MIELYTHPMSPCAQKVRIVLAEKNLEWTGRHIDLPGKENLEPWYLKLNRLGVVPTLVEDGRAVIESSIICEYLEDRYPDPRLRPDDPHDIATMRFWMKQVDNKLHPSCGALQWPVVMRDKLLALPEAEQMAKIDRVVEKPRRERQRRLLKMGLDAPDIKDAVGTYHRFIVDMEAALADSEWVVGNRFSLADCCLAPYFQTLYQFGWNELYESGYPRVTDWYARIRERHSYRGAVIADFPDATLAELREKGGEGLEKIREHRAAAAGG
jgi:glutathione S-transferase